MASPYFTSEYIKLNYDKPPPPAAAAGRPKNIKMPLDSDIFTPRSTGQSVTVKIPKVPLDSVFLHHTPRSG